MSWFLQEFSNSIADTDKESKPVRAVIPVEISPVKFRDWNQKAKDADMLMEDWIIKLVDQAAGDDERTANIADFPEAPSFELPFYGSVAAGEQITTQLEGETAKVSKSYPTGYFVVEVNGESMMPTLDDGERIVCETKEHTPADGKVCIVSDGHGSCVKRFDRKRKAFVSDNLEFPDLTPISEVTLQGYYVETLPSE